jgi:BMFP domain-containing protein YqiC
MKLPMPTANEIWKIANRAEDTINNTNSRSNHHMCVENAIREALQIVLDRLDVQLLSPLAVDLSKS